MYKFYIKFMENCTFKIFKNHKKKHKTTIKKIFHFHKINHKKSYQNHIKIINQKMPKIKTINQNHIEIIKNHKKKYLLKTAFSKHIDSQGYRTCCH